MEAQAPLDSFGPELPRPGVAATIVRITGSAPQKVGAKMWVTAERFFGTLGGGRFEAEVLGHARETLSRPGAQPRVREYVLCREMGQCCGGRVEVFLEPAWPRRTAHLFGAGHVGRATAQVLSGMPFSVVLVDPRPDWASAEGLPPEVRVERADPVEYASGRDWTTDDAACIFTHSHDLDLALARLLLPKPLGYLGLIGSGHKADVFLARLRSGLPREESERIAELWESRMHCPIGEALDSKHPKVIAVAIASQLLKDWALASAAQAPEPRPAAAGVAQARPG